MRLGDLALVDKLLLTYPEYVWYPEVLANASHSTEYLGYQVASYKGCSCHAGLIVGDNARKFIEKKIVQEGLGIHDATKSEIDLLVSHKSSSLLADYTLADMISTRARIGVRVSFFKFNYSGLHMDIQLWM